MPARQTRKGFFWGWNTGESGWKPGHDQTIQNLQYLVQGTVVRSDLATPPSSPNEGDCWAVPVSPAPTGSWAGHGGKIAGWDGLAWDFIAPERGWNFFDASLGVDITFDGTSFVQKESKPRTHQHQIADIVGLTSALAVGVVYSPEQYNAVGDGAADDKASFDAMWAAIPNGATVALRAGANYRLSGQSVCGKSVTILGRGATVSGTGSLLGFLSLKSTLSSGPYGTTVAGQAEVTLSTGLSIVAGDLLVLESDTVRLSYGNYKWGQVVLVKSYTSGTGQCLLAQPCVGAFQIDRIKVYAGNRVHVSDLNFDNSAATNGSTATGMAFRGERMVVERCRFVGATEAAQGLDAIGHTLRVRDSRAVGYLHYSGTGGSRLGYGWNLVGDDCEVVNSNGERNKHSVDSASRSVVTRRLAVIGGTYVTPKSQVSGMAMGGTEPLYQYQVGVHANVIDFSTTWTTLDGINSQIGVRNGRASISNIAIYSRDTQATDAVNNLVLVAESPVVDLSIDGVRLYVDAGTKVNTTVLLGGLEWTTGAHKNVRVRNVDLDGGILYRMQGNTNSGTSTLDGLSISGVRGRVARLVDIGGVVGNTKVGAISNISISDVEVETETGMGMATVANLIAVTNVPTLTGLRISDCRLGHTGHTVEASAINVDVDTSATDIYLDGVRIDSHFGGVRIKAPTVSNLQADQLDLRDDAGSSTARPAFLVDCASLGYFRIARPRIRAAFTGINLSMSTGVVDEPISSSITDVDILYNMVSGGAAFVQGIYVASPALWTKKWQIRGGEIRRKEAALDALSQPIRANNKFRADIANLTLSDDWAISDTYESTSPPVGCRRADGVRLPWKGDTLLTPSGELYRVAIPASGTWAAGDRVFKDGPSAGGKIGWVSIGGGGPATFKAWGAIDA